jgi:hypothetical protein
VIPSLDLIVVRNGSQISPEGNWDGVEDHLLNPLMAALAAGGGAPSGRSTADPQL